MKKMYRDCGLKIPDKYVVPGSRIPGEKRIIEGGIQIDYSVFKKTPDEKRLLKILKSKNPNKN